MTDAANPHRKPFLTAAWESLLLLNYPCPRELLAPLVPAGTLLDPWRGEHLVSLVGFRFIDTRVRGIAFPWHRHFEEVNLRFYVRRTPPGESEARRAVVFVRELVPRWIIAAIARTLYNEPYLAVPMDHEVDLDPETGGTVRYGWRHRGKGFSMGARASFSMGARARGPARNLAPGSEAEFITEHYWGYTRQRDGGTLEYQVEHPPWRVWEARDAEAHGPFEALYGPRFAEILAQPPHSAFIAAGSEVAVHHGRRIATEGNGSGEP